ncbi:Uncharacterised protein [Serratia proteamaculans]|uniref:hypothetical protein n=1 Tax=Serratia proteamaculans TaxID=28151 RepID=UPI00217A428F|nr:hypothetical protein [Serratia proteamaculans]CAI1705365.1 Uncharacterised protein [Serratia proteamaculans]
MTQTLTTEALRALRDSLKSWQDGYDPVDDEEQYEMFVTAETAVGELLANREAQPVGFISAKHGPVLYGESIGLPVGTHFYTAPPAPAVPKEMTLSEAESFIKELTPPTEEEAALFAWNACRAAMLAQPVSQRYKLVPIEPTPKQWAAGLMAIDTGMDKVTLVYKAMLAAAPEGGNG